MALERCKRLVGTTTCFVMVYLYVTIVVAMSFVKSNENHSAWPIYGHADAVHLLESVTQPFSSSTDTAATVHLAPRHAYLLIGPQQIGKSTLGQTFAHGLLCTNDSTRPCGACRSCRLMASGNHPDFRLVQPVEKDGTANRINGIIRVEQAADLIREASLRPVEGGYKVFLIREMHMANDGFANKMLKTLEEPAQHVVFCLTAPNRSSLLPTIVSRCQVIEMRPLLHQEVETALIKEWQAGPERAALLARLSHGRMGWAVAQLRDPQSQEKRQEQLRQLWQLASAGRVARLAFAEQLATKRTGEQLFSLLEFWLTWWRDVMLAQVGCANACSNIDQQAEVLRQAQSVSPKSVQGYIQTLQRIEVYLHHTTNLRLALDVLLLQMPKLA